MIGSIISKFKVQSAFNAFNSRNIKEFTTGWDDDAVFIYPGDFSVSGEYSGKQQIEIRNMKVHRVQDYYFDCNMLRKAWASKQRNPGKLSGEEYSEKLD
jgi:hypothetical protein